MSTSSKEYLHHDVGGTFFFFDRSRNSTLREFVLLYPLDHSRGIKRFPAIERAKKGNTVCQTHVEIHATLKFAAGTVFQFPVSLRKIKIGINYQDHQSVMIVDICGRPDY